MYGFKFIILSGWLKNISVFPILVLDLAELDELHMDNGIDCPWISEMFIIYETVHYSWIAEMENNIMHG